MNPINPDAKCAGSSTYKEGDFPNPEGIEGLIAHHCGDYREEDFPEDEGRADFCQWCYDKGLRYPGDGTPWRHAMECPSRCRTGETCPDCGCGSSVDPTDAAMAICDNYPQCPLSVMGTGWRRGERASVALSEIERLTDERDKLAAELSQWHAISKEFAARRNKAETKAADLRELIVEMRSWNKLTEIEISNLRSLYEEEQERSNSLHTEFLCLVEQCEAECCDKESMGRARAALNRK